MSVRVMSLVWGWALPATEKLVALKLADCADDQGRNAWPAVATIAADCGLSRRGTQEVLRRLQARGCIEVQAEPTNRKSTTYRVLLAAQVPGVAEAAAAADQAARDVPSTRPLDGESLMDARRRLEAAAGCRGAAGAPLGANVVREGGAPAAQGGAPAAPLGANVARPIRQTTVIEPSRDPSRAREGRRQHPLDEPLVLTPKQLEQLDALRLAYPRKDGNPRDDLRVWRELNLSSERAEFVVAHVRMRVAAGWVRQAGGVNYLPMLWRWLERRGWQEQAAPAAAVSSGLEGMRTVRCCDKCGAELEGRVVAGVAMIPPCARCRASAGAGGAEGVSG